MPPMAKRSQPAPARGCQRRELPDERMISLRDLLRLFKDRGVNEATIVRLREGWFIPRPVVTSLGDDAGTASFYPEAVTVPNVKRYLKLSEAAARGEAPRNKDDWLWQM